MACRPPRLAGARGGGGKGGLGDTAERDAIVYIFVARYARSSMWCSWAWAPTVRTASACPRYVPTCLALFMAPDVCACSAHSSGCLAPSRWPRRPVSSLTRRCVPPLLETHFALPIHTCERYAVCAHTRSTSAFMNEWVCVRVCMCGEIGGPHAARAYSGRVYSGTCAKAAGRRGRCCTGGRARCKLARHPLCVWMHPLMRNGSVCVATMLDGDGQRVTKGAGASIMPVAAEAVDAVLVGDHALRSRGGATLYLLLPSANVTGARPYTYAPGTGRPPPPPRCGTAFWTSQVRTIVCAGLCVCLCVSVSISDASCGVCSERGGRMGWGRGLGGAGGMAGCGRDGGGAGAGRRRRGRRQC
jgi:hypothetical protein